MTIAVCLKVQDGLVLGADSASSLLTGGGVSNIYNNANKIVSLRKGLPIGVMFWGAGGIGDSSMSTLAKDLRVRFTGEDPAHLDWHIDPAAYELAEVADRVKEFIYDEHYLPGFAGETEFPTMGLFVAGYSAGAALAEVYEINVGPDGVCAGPAVTCEHDDYTMTWRGQPEIITRLVLGFSDRLPHVLVERFGLPEAEIEQAIEILRAETEINLLHPAMPIQDAIDLADFLVETCKSASRFLPEAPTIGGPTELVAITKHEGFKWVRRKHYYSREFNPEEWDQL